MKYSSIDKFERWLLAGRSLEKSMLLRAPAAELPVATDAIMRAAASIANRLFREV
jgi:hypothetical protein